MAKKGSITIQGALTVCNAYMRLGGISGGKQSGFWQADIQVFSDGGTAAQAYEAAMAAYNAAQAQYASAMAAYEQELAAYPAAVTSAQQAATAVPAEPVKPTPSIDPDAIPSTVAMDAVRVDAGLALLRAQWDGSTPPYTALYAQMGATYTGLTDA